MRLWFTHPGFTRRDQKWAGFERGRDDHNSLAATAKIEKAAETVKLSSPRCYVVAKVSFHGCAL